MQSTECSIDGCGREVHARGWCKKHHQNWVRGGDPVPLSRKPVEDRFWAKVNPTGFCWEWTGYVHRSGYGAFTPHEGETPQQAHRFAYELLIGPIPEGLVIDHLCRNKSCVNPDHLEPVTIQENTLRGYSESAMNARKTHCKNGHEFTPENMWISGVGARLCRACYLAKQRRRTIELRNK